MRRRAVPLVLFAILGVLAAATAGVVVHEENQAATPAPTKSVPSTTTTAAPASTTTVVPVPGSIEAVLPELEAFVARERGLAFKTPVDVDLVGEAQFRARVTEIDEEDREELRDAQAVLIAMGLLEEEVDLEAVVTSFSEEAILGFYDPETKELVVRGTSPTPFVRSVLVHELTHALEDQHFDLNREDLGDEATIGFEALAEGSALRIEDRYRSSMSRQDRRDAERAEEKVGEGVSDDVPEVIQLAFGFPYAYGPDLVRSIVRAGGQARLDAAFADPPASSEQVLDPRRYLRNDAPRSVPLPRADRAAIDEGEIGELFLILMLRAELDGDVARTAARGWGGDSYVAWRDGRRTCVRMTFVMDTPRDTAELTEALRDWADARGAGAKASGSTLTTCG
ncbi:MAG TPA: hypothetical protein VM142_11335 [Acidimicrobiales bacterium]|nr:hypothetical protein [Acidimicrobiales bacterium]